MPKDRGPPLTSAPLPNATPARLVREPASARPSELLGGQPSRAQPSRPSPLARALARIKELEPAIKAAEANREKLLRKPHVIDVRAGYKFTDGKITDTPAVVVLVDRKVADPSSKERIPPVVDGILTDVTPADPFERLRRRGQESTAVVPPPPRLLIDEIQMPDEALEEALPMTTYSAPANGDLSAVTGAMTITCHVSPDAGWKVLEPFLSATERELCLGMYDFTAPHIYRTARTLLKNESVSWKQTIGPKESLPGAHDVDSTKADDLTEEQVNTGLSRVARDRFENAFARVGAGRTFASAYHIKVAVRDKKVVLAVERQLAVVESARHRLSRCRKLTHR